MLKVDQVTARYNTSKGAVIAVQNVSLEIKPNEIVGIAGESGCGKSTLLKIMYDSVQQPLEIVSGKVKIHTTDELGSSLAAETGDIRKIWWKSISYVPQAAMSVLNPVIRIENQFFDAVSRFHKFKNKSEIREQVTDFLKELQLPVEILKSYPHQLSGGMKQRVVIALATFLHPQIVLADEPTTALDVVVQRGILAMLTRVQKRMANSLVIVSHDLGVHYQITHRLAIMYAGKLVELGPTDAIFNKPLHPYTAALINALPRVGDATQKQGIAGRPPSLLNPPAGCRFAARCSMAKEICSKVEPALTEVEPGHYVECHLYREA